MDDLPVEAIGMVWYREADYNKVVAMFVDGPRLHPTFKQWEHDAEQGRQGLITKGKFVIKTYIDPATFPQWCVEHGHVLDARGRNAFGAAEAMRIVRKMQSGD